MTTNAGVYKFTDKDELHIQSDEKQRSVSVSSRSSKGMYQHHEGSSDIKFWIVFAVSQVVGLSIIAMAIHWAKLNGGFSWNGNPDLQFFLHPVFMILGLVFFFGDAIIIYRVLSFLPKNILKIIHGLLHVFAILSSIFGLVAVLEFHRRTKKPDFYSIHSWIGISTFGLFCFQYISGFVTFLYPGLPAAWRARAMPFHTFFGCGLFLMAIVAAETGLNEKLIWTSNYTAATFSEQAVVGNLVGLAMIIFGFFIIFIATHTAYKRKPLPEELSLTVRN